jgi:hypothetical protein
MGETRTSPATLQRRRQEGLERYLTGDPIAAQTWPRHPFHQCGNARLYSAPVRRSLYAVGMSSKSHNCCPGKGRCPGRLGGLGRYTIKESWGVNGISAPWSEAKRVG